MMLQPAAELFALCDYASLSQEGKLSLAGIFDRIYSSQFPIQYPRFFVVAVLKGESLSNHRITMSVISPMGKECLPHLDIQATFGGSGKTHIIQEVVGTTFSEPGEYMIQLIVNGEAVQTLSLFVTNTHAQPVVHKPAAN